MATEGVNFRYFVLGLLDQQPMSGYDIKRLLERLNGLIGSSSFGHIYPTLHTLLKEGWVTVNVVTREDRPPRKVYTIRQEGASAPRMARTAGSVKPLTEGACHALDLGTGCFPRAG